MKIKRESLVKMIKKTSRRIPVKASYVLPSKKIKETHKRLTKIRRQNYETNE